jgi:hypothetical protein
MAVSHTRASRTFVNGAAVDADGGHAPAAATGYLSGKRSRAAHAAFLAASIAIAACGRVAAQTGVTLPAAGAQAEGQSLPAATPGIELSVRFYDKRIYFPESEIPLKVTITNNSSAPYRFKLADDRVHSLSFEARTPTNRLLDPSDAYRLAMSESRPVFYREIAIEPGEEYSFVENLEHYVRIAGPGVYMVKASLSPELAGPAAVLSSNSLSLSVRPSPGLPPASDTVKLQTGEVLKAQAAPPDEVVRRTITARQKGLWNEFFLYLDLESLMKKNEDKKRAYDRESDEGRRRMLERYRADMQTNVVDNDIIVQPYYFEVLETRYTPSRGFVRVLEKFQSQQLRMIKEYTYELERRDGVWFIVGYTVLNKGTE